MEVVEYCQKFEVQQKSFSEDILRTSLPIWMKMSVYVGIGVESETSPSQYNRTNISP